MSDLLEGLGTASEGGLFARALEPESGARKPHPDQPETCLNCGTELTGAYCHACGQQGHLHRTIGAFMQDLLHGALHFEGKLWRTLPMLIFRPGKLTRRYIEGERARFVSPMALFLFGVFLMFAVFQMVGLTTPTTLGGDDEGFVSGLSDGFNDSAASGDEADVAEADAAEPVTAQSARAEMQEQRDEIKARLDATAPDDPGRAAIETELSEIDRAIAIVDQASAFAAGDNGSAKFSGTGIEWIDDGLIKKWEENPGLMLYKLQANAYKFSWMLIPISIPFVWLLFFWKRRFRAYDHAIFVTYSLAFMTLLFITASLLVVAGIAAGPVFIAVMLIPPIHLYKQLRHAYELRRFSAFWRLLVLSAFIWIAVSLFLQLLFVLGAF